MKRFHVHVAVNDLAASVNFYASVFGTLKVESKSCC